MVQAQFMSIVLSNHVPELQTCQTLKGNKITMIINSFIITIIIDGKVAENTPAPDQHSLISRGENDNLDVSTT